METGVRLIETTLRDGSYEVDFQFTPDDTALLASAFDQAGVEYIEVGHGNGFGADRSKGHRPKIRAAASDEEYFAAAQSVVGRAALGTIFVVGPQLTPIEDLDALPGLGVKFVRLAFFPDKLSDPECLAYIDRAKSLGLTVSVNFLRTYTATPQQVAQRSVEVARRGADWFYIVDSAGGMLPSEVEAYVRAVRDASGLVVGVHAHNNRGLAVANSIAAIAAGATRVDGTLQGIGRATGNPPTEQLLLLLQRLGHEQGVDLDAVLRLGELVRGLFAEKGTDSTYFISGMARLHSEKATALRGMAQKEGRSVPSFLAAVAAAGERLGALGKESFPPELNQAVDEALAATPRVSIALPHKTLVDRLARTMQPLDRPDVAKLCESIFVASRKRRKQSVFHLVSPRAFPHPGALAWEHGPYLGVTVPYSAEARWAPLPEERGPDLVLIDEAVGELDPGFAARARMLRHSFGALITDATADLIGAVRSQESVVHLTGLDEPLHQLLVPQLAARSIAVSDGLAPSTRPQIVITTPASLGDWLPSLRAGDLVVLLGHDAATPELVDRVRRGGAKVLRPLLGPAIASKVSALVALAERLAQPLQPSPCEGLSLVDALVVPSPADVVVDDLRCPNHLLDTGGRPLSELAAPLAAYRARVLLAGQGTL